MAKVNLALAGLPVFPAAGSGPEAERLLRGRIVIAPGIDYVERAFDASKYGAISPAPVPRGDDPVARRPDPGRRTEGGRPAAGPPRDEHPPPVRAVSARRGHLAGPPRRARRPRDPETLEAYAPGIGKLVTARQVLTPARPGARLRPHRRASVSRRAEPRQLLPVAAAPRQRPLPAADRRPVPRRLRRPSGRRDHREFPGQNAAREILSDWKKRRR